MYSRLAQASRHWCAVASLAIGFVLFSCSDSSTGTRTPTQLIDRRLVALVSDTNNFGGTTSIFVMHADGTHKTRLTSSNFLDDAPSWTPDGSHIAFSSNRPPAGMWIMNADGSDQRPFVVADSLGARDISWSPDGRSIAFVVLSPTDGIFEIMIASADGSHARRLTNDPGDELWPSWSPDGRHVAFMRVEPGGSKIFVSDADGSAEKQLSADDTDQQPRWSPDGTRIAFTNLADSYHPQIFVMRADGSDRRALTSDGVYDSPEWSPDGKQIEFNSMQSDGGLVIVRMNADGSDARAVTTNGTVVGSAWSNSWSPVWKPVP